MTMLTVISFGHAEVLREGRAVQWGAESARDLVFLLLSSPLGRSREEIIDQLWHDDFSVRSDNRFRVALHRARGALGGLDRIVEDFGRYHLADNVLRNSDVFHLYAALAEADGVQGLGRLLALNHAITLYRGDFLPQMHSEWVRAAREEHRTAYTHALLERSLLYCEYVQCRLSVQDMADALRIDPFLGEDFHQKLMACLSVVEGKYAATEHYRRFVSFLKEQLNDTPMPDTEELAAHLKSGERVCRRNQHLTVTFTHNCPLTSGGRCPNPFADLLDHT